LPQLAQPKVGKGAKTISLTVEKDLLDQADAYAKRHGISRAKLVAQGLQAVSGSAA
jgi:metal-responsive CopG/Arc/MetJ family transcriptional regulator